MSSLPVLNKATKSKRGNGLPFYNDLKYVFSNWNNGFNDNLGLLNVPTGKVPTFQIWAAESVFKTLKYLETRGGNDFTGSTFTPAISITPIGVVDSELGAMYIFETYDVGTLITPAPEGRWVAELTLNDGFSDIIYYSEEFLTKSKCC